MKKVTIVQRVLPHYRIPFFEQLHEILEKQGITLNLIYGQELPGTVPKTFDFNRAWAHRIRNRYFKFGYREAVWQPCIKLLRNSDLIIIEQSNRLLLNFLLLARSPVTQIKLAYWGHGKNMQATGRKQVSEALKKILATKVDWWFAYTELSRDTIVRLGFPPNKVSVVQNSIDTRGLAEAVDSLEKATIQGLKQKLGITSSNVCIFLGGMYPDKWLDFLLRSCKIIRKSIPDFHMLFIGSGPEEHKVKKAAAEKPWIHYIGPVYGTDRAPYLAISKASLMPGLVGLGIIDSFVAKAPIFTTENQIHSPEIQYLEDHVNGIMTAASENAFAHAIVEYLNSDTLQKMLEKGCSRSADEYTLDNMVNRFAEGIEQALAI